MRSKKNKNEKNNELKIFDSEEFGKVRTLIINEKPYFCASDIAKS